MDFFLGFLGLLYLTYRLGKDDGNWGCFSLIIGLVGLVFLLSMFK